MHEGTGRAWLAATGLLCFGLALSAAAAVTAGAAAVAVLLLALLALPVAPLVVRAQGRRAEAVAAPALVLGLAALSFSVTTLGVLGWDGRSPHTVGWAHPGRAWLPTATIGAGLLWTGLRSARRVSWIRELQGGHGAATGSHRRAGG